jgi:uncharacterized protein (DUF736 family)
MATIGTVKKTNKGYEGELCTLSIRSQIKLVPLTDRKSDSSPDYRIVTRDGFELGAAWHKTARSGSEYTSLKLDAPEFPAPLFANLGRAPGSQADEGLFSIIWDRR